jgi:phage-related baseplate assembly protein
MATSSTTVDLSRLPAPELVEQLDFETIFARKVAKLRELLPEFDAAVDSDPAVKVLQVASYDELLIRQDFQDRARQLLVAYATGGNLDHIGALLGVPRLVLSPADPVTGAAAILEGDDAFRQRIVLAPEELSVAGPELAYVSLAKRASGTVLDASAISPAPGQVLVSVLSREGDGAASPELVAAVAAVVTDPARRPLGDQVSVASAIIRPYAVQAQLVTDPGPDVALVLDAARASVAVYRDRQRRLGRDVTRVGVVAALTVPGVEDVLLASPAANLVCGPTEAGWCTGIDVAHAGFAA